MPLLTSVLQCEFRGMVERIMEAADLGEDVGVGWMRLSESAHKKPRHVNWIPRGGTPVQDAKPQQFEWQGRSYTALGMEELRVDCIIRGHADGEPIDGFEDAEFIRRQLVAAYFQIAKELRPRSTIGPHEWVTQDEGNEAHALNNRQLCIQRFGWVQPIVKSGQTTTTITIQPDHDCTLVPATATAQEFVNALIPW